MSKIAAFFDIDGTLYRDELISEIFKKFIEYEIISPDKWHNEVKPEYLKWDNRQGNYDNYLFKIANIYIEAVKGLHKSQVGFIAKQVVEQKGDRVYTYTRDRIQYHKNKGHKIIAISGSPIELVKEMSYKHGFDDFEGAIYVLDGDMIYTGEVIPMWDSNSKKRAINRFVKKYDINLKESYAYGDTIGDFSMLQMVKYPICVNPTKELIKKVLKDKNIKDDVKFIVERKDVIYKLKPEYIDIY